MENRAAIETSSSSDAKAPQSTEANTLVDAWTELGSAERSRRGRAGEPVAGSPLDDLDDLIDASCAGDGVALNRLLAHARPRLLAVALRIVRDRDDAEDVVQEALLKVCRHITRFEGRSAFSTWLHRIVVNAGLDRLRRHQSRWDRVAGDADREEGRVDAPEGVDEETPERLVARAETTAVVQDAIAALSPAHQEALSLREIQGESYQAIARISHVPVGTVMSRLHHARRRLAEQLATSFDPPSLQAA
jgi:RNA polymerase sigma-70 factor (ECF subfamily)